MKFVLYIREVVRAYFMFLDIYRAGLPREFVKQKSIMESIYVLKKVGYKNEQIVKILLSVYRDWTSQNNPTET